MHFNLCRVRVEARVVRRGNRSLGFGFVTYESEGHADLARAQLNKQTFNEREINVELAKHASERSAERPARQDGFPSRGRGGSRGGIRGGRGSFRGGRRANASRAENATPSATGLFVANLPFEMDDAALANLFGQFKVVKAHVVTYRSSSRSKGYGFVEFASHEEQQRALSSMADTVVGDRPLSIKVALNTPTQEEAAEGTA